MEDKEFKQDFLFEQSEIEKDWEKEWIGMPEYVQERKEEYAKIIVRFRNEEDLQEFAKLVEQNLNIKTQSIWFPKLIFQDHFSKRYIDES
jgi:hypothetical protein